MLQGGEDPVCEGGKAGVPSLQSGVPCEGEEGGVHCVQGGEQKCAVPPGRCEVVGEEEEEVSEGRHRGLAGRGSWVGMAGNKAGLTRLGVTAGSLRRDRAGVLCASLKKCLQLSFSRHCFAVVVIVFFLPRTLSAHRCLLFLSL